MSNPTHKRSRFRRFFLFGGLPVLAGLGLFLVPRAHAFGPWHGPHGHHAPRSAADVREHLGRRVEHLLDEVDASDAQRDKVEAIVDAAAPKLFALFEDGRGVRTELKTALLADTLDRARIDKARADLDALANRATDLGIGTMADIAAVLTPAQRKQVADELARMHP